MEIMDCITALVAYGREKELLAAKDESFVTNSLLELFELDEYEKREVAKRPLEELLEDMMSYAFTHGIMKSEDIVTKDLFDTRIMSKLMPRPSEVNQEFAKRYAKSPEEATNYYYELSKASNYIRTARVAKDVKWIGHSEYGDMDITINLSKPEKDPKAIAAALAAKQSSYPKCLLCKENVGYAGRGNHPARQNHRIIPMRMNQEDWYLQYSPYVYYNEHCIVFNGEHTPMKINHATFVKLFDFVTLFPHYFLGSNADLPIVGGSILTHDHFQGGHYEFAMARAEVENAVHFQGYEDIKAGIVKWPMSVLRLRGPKKERIIELCDKILAAWRGYTNEDCFIFAETEGTPHNTITPIARRRGEDYEMDLVLRNNITTKEHPLGVYHPHAEHHHIKKENIGLIEVMGLAVLPSRLKTEMGSLAEALVEGKNLTEDELLSKHADWVESFRGNYEKITKDNVDEILQKEVSDVYVNILEQAGVYKRTREGRKGFLDFVEYVNR